MILTKEKFIQNIKRIHDVLEKEEKFGKLFSCVPETGTEWLIDSLLVVMEDDLGISDGLLCDWSMASFFSPKNDFIVTVKDGSLEKKYNLKTAEDFWDYWEKEIKQGDKL